MVRYLCGIPVVSRSGYYNYFSFPRERENQDEIGKGFILEVSQFKNRRKGVRQITLKLAGQFQGVYNLKRIPRIMKKH